MEDDVHSSILFHLMDGIGFPNDIKRTNKFKLLFNVINKINNVVLLSADSKVNKNSRIIQWDDNIELNISNKIINGHDLDNIYLIIKLISIPISNNQNNNNSNNIVSAIELSYISYLNKFKNNQYKRIDNIFEFKDIVNNNIRIRAGILIIDNNDIYNNKNNFNINKIKESFISNDMKDLSNNVMAPSKSTNNIINPLSYQSNHLSSNLSYSKSNYLPIKKQSVENQSFMLQSLQLIYKNIRKSCNISINESVYLPSSSLVELVKMISNNTSNQLILFNNEIIKLYRKDVIQLDKSNIVLDTNMSTIMETLNSNTTINKLLNFNQLLYKCKIVSISNDVKIFYYEEYVTKCIIRLLNKSTNITDSTIDGAIDNNIDMKDQLNNMENTVNTITNDIKVLSKEINLYPINNANNSDSTIDNKLIDDNVQKKEMKSDNSLAVHSVALVDKTNYIHEIKNINNVNQSEQFYNKIFNEVSRCIDTDNDSNVDETQRINTMDNISIYQSIIQVYQEKLSQFIDNYFNNIANNKYNNMSDINLFINQINKVDKLLKYISKFSYFQLEKLTISKFLDNEVNIENNKHVYISTLINELTQLVKSKIYSKSFIKFQQNVTNFLSIYLSIDLTNNLAEDFPNYESIHLTNDLRKFFMNKEILNKIINIQSYSRKFGNVSGLNNDLSKTIINSLVKQIDVQNEINTKSNNHNSIDNMLSSTVVDLLNSKDFFYIKSDYKENDLHLTYSVLKSISLLSDSLKCNFIKLSSGLIDIFLSKHLDSLELLSVVYVLQLFDYKFTNHVNQRNNYYLPFEFIDFYCQVYDTEQKFSNDINNYEQISTHPSNTIESFIHEFYSSHDDIKSIVVVDDKTKLPVVEAKDEGLNELDNNIPEDHLKQDNNIAINKYDKEISEDRSNSKQYEVANMFNIASNHTHEDKHLHKTNHEQSHEIEIVKQVDNSKDALKDIAVDEVKPAKDSITQQNQEISSDSVSNNNQEMPHANSHSVTEKSNNNIESNKSKDKIVDETTQKTTAIPSSVAPIEIKEMSSLSTGDKILALYDTTSNWYPGSIVSYDENSGLYHVKYDDGDEGHCTRLQIKRQGDKQTRNLSLNQSVHAYCPSQDGSYLPGKIINVLESKYIVEFTLKSNETVREELARPQIFGPHLSIDEIKFFSKRKIESYPNRDLSITNELIVNSKEDTKSINNNNINNDNNQNFEPIESKPIAEIKPNEIINSTTTDKPKQNLAIREINVNDKVEGRYGHGFQWFPATVTDIITNNLTNDKVYSLLYDDGDTETNVNRISIRFKGEKEKGGLQIGQTIFTSCELLTRLNLALNDNNCIQGTVIAPLPTALSGTAVYHIEFNMTELKLQKEIEAAISELKESERDKLLNEIDFVEEDIDEHTSILKLREKIIRKKLLSMHFSSNK